MSGWNDRAREQKYAITDMGYSPVVTRTDGVGDPINLGRYGVWTVSPTGTLTDVIDCGDDLALLMSTYGVGPEDVHALPRPNGLQQGQD